MNKGGGWYYVVARVIWQNGTHDFHTSHHLRRATWLRAYLQFSLQLPTAIVN